MRVKLHTKYNTLELLGISKIVPSWSTESLNVTTDETLDDEKALIINMHEVILIEVTKE